MAIQNLDVFQGTPAQMSRVNDTVIQIDDQAGTANALTADQVAIAAVQQWVEALAPDDVRRAIGTYVVVRRQLIRSVRVDPTPGFSYTVV